MKITRSKNEGMVKHEIVMESGGSIGISVFEKDVVNFKIANGKGLASFKNLRSSKEIEKECDSVKEITWMTMGEKSYVRAILQDAKSN